MTERRFAWRKAANRSRAIVVFDQGLSSLSNLAASVALARQTTVHGFGQFAVAFSVYMLALGSFRGIFLDPVLILTADTTDGEQRRSLNEAASLVVISAATIGACIAVVAYLFHFGAPLILVGVFLAGLMLQDAVRYFAFVLRPSIAALSDAIWTAITVTMLFLSVVYAGVSGIRIFVLWESAGLLAGILGLAILRIRFRRIERIFSITVFRLGFGFLAEYWVGSGIGQAVVLIVTAIVGVETAGSIRAAQVLLGPLNVLFTGTLAAMIPVASRSSSRNDLDKVFKVSKWMSVALAVAALLCTSVIAVLPERLGTIMLGVNWSRAHEVAILLGLGMVPLGIMLGASLGLRGTRRSGSVFAARAISAPITLIAGVTGGIALRAVGVAVGLDIGNAVAAIAYWAFLLRGTDPDRERNTDASIIFVPKG